MNGLNASTNFNSTWGEHTPITQYVYGIIDSKIDYFELKTRKLLDNFRKDGAKGFHQSDSHYHVPSMSDLSVDKSDNELLFKHVENLSRAIYLLEQFKLSLNEDNAYSVIELLNDDNYLKVNDLKIQEVLQYKLAA